MKRLRHVRRAMKLIREAAGGWAAAWLVLVVVQGAIPGGIVYMTKWVVDAAEAAVGQGVSWEQVSQLLLPASIMGGLLLAQRFIGSVTEYVNTAQSEFVGDHLKNLIHDKAARVEYWFYESDRYYDLLEQANSQASSRTLGLLQNIGSLMSSAVTFVTISALLVQYSVWLPLVLVASTAPAFWVLLRYNRIYHRWWEETTPDRRRAKYYDLMLTKQEAAAEVRLNNLGDHFRTLYQSVRRRLRGERLDLLRNQTIAQFFAGVVALLSVGGAMAWIAWRAFLGQARLGDMALFYQAFNQGQGIVRQVLNNLGQIYTNTLFLEHFFALLDHPLRRDGPDEPEPFPARLSDGVRFESVTFTYPGADQPALKNFDLHLPAGKIMSIVGENGAGKSTVVKLLSRLYDPQDGRILVDGTDIRQFTEEELRRNLSVMFQFPVKFQLTARENIALGDLERPDNESIREAAEGAGAHPFLSTLPKQYDAMLGRWFAGGNELSGGEWQRVALSRAYYRQARILVLDEPTSHMDSWNETEWLHRFKNLVDDRTGLIITHRFTTAMHADRILVMDDGDVVESGTHEELLIQDGRYATSWRAQIEDSGLTVES